MIENYLSAFRREYQAEVATDLPTTKCRRLFFPGASEIDGRGGLVVSVTPSQGSQWMGVFGFGFGGGAVTALSSTPDPHKLLVVSRGAGYFVSSENPEVWTDIPQAIPITSVWPIPDHKMIVLANYTSLAAFGASGFLWKTGRVSFDGITITHINADHIEGEAWDPTARTPPRFLVEIRTGKLTGGASPEKYGIV